MKTTYALRIATGTIQTTTGTTTVFVAFSIHCRKGQNLADLRIGQESQNKGALNVPARDAILSG